MEPQLINNFAAAAFCAFKDFGISSEGDCDMEVIRTEQVSNTLAIGNASDLAAVWLSCAASNQQWFQGLLVFSRELSVSLQARSSQTACIPFSSGDESWCLDQSSITSFTSP